MKKTAKTETMDLAISQEGNWLRYIGDLKQREVSTKRDPGPYGRRLRVGGTVMIDDWPWRIKEVGDRIFTCGEGFGGDNHTWVTVSRRVDQ